MVVHIRILQNKSKLWSFLGFLSSIVGLVCFALSSSFKHLFGEWNHLKLLFYIIISSIICSTVLFAKKIHVSRSFMVKSHLGFLVLMLTSLYSYFYDRAVNGKPDASSIVSYAAFAFMSLCFSKKMELGFEVGLFNFFLGFLTIQLMEINLIFGFVAAIFCYSLIICRCYIDSQLEILPSTSSIKDCISIRIDSANGETQPSPSIGEFTSENISGENQQNSPSFQCEPTRQGSVSGDTISGKNHQRNSEEEKSLSVIQDETRDQVNVTSENNLETVEKQSFTGNQSNPQYLQLRRRERSNFRNESMDQAFSNYIDRAKKKLNSMKHIEMEKEGLT